MQRAAKPSREAKQARETTLERLVALMELRKRQPEALRARRVGRLRWLVASAASLLVAALALPGLPLAVRGKTRLETGAVFATTDWRPGHRRFDERPPIGFARHSHVGRPRIFQAMSRQRMPHFSCGQVAKMRTVDSEFGILHRNGLSP